MPTNLAAEGVRRAAESERRRGLLRRGEACGCGGRTSRLEGARPPATGAAAAAAASRVAEGRGRERERREAG